MENSSELLKKEQVAEMLNIKPSTVGKLARDGKLPKVMVGDKLTRFLKEDVDAYIANRRG